MSANPNIFDNSKVRIQDIPKRGRGVVAASSIDQGELIVSAPVLVRFIAAVASRFGIVVTQKALAQSLPILGAVGGGLVNTMFISHFQDMARGHFAIRRLERQYGEVPVRNAYQRLRTLGSSS